MHLTACRPGEGPPPAQGELSLATCSTLIFDALLPSLLERAGMRPASQQHAVSSSSLEDCDEEQGIFGSHLLEQYARDSSLTPLTLAAVANVYLARESCNFQLWPEAQLRGFLTSFKLASQVRIEQCQGKEQLVALVQEAAAHLVPAHVQRLHGWPAAAGGLSDGATEAGEAGAAANQRAEVAFPPVLPRDQAWLRCAVCGASRDEVALKECIGCKSVMLVVARGVG